LSQPNIFIMTPFINSKTTNLIYNAFKNRNVEVYKICLSNTNLFISNKSIYYDKQKCQNDKLYSKYLAKNIINFKPDAIISRGIGIRETKKIFFRVDIYRALEILDIPVINSSLCLELATNKMLTSLLLKQNNIPTPDTYICEKYKDAISAYELLGGDIIFKPMFGSKGVGITRINDKNFAEYFFYNVSKLGEPFYLQKFMEHGNKDIRAFVINDEVIASMERIGTNWKTNIFQGAIGKPINLSDDLKEICIKSANIVKAKISGIDIIQTNEGYYVIEVNAVPGFNELQNVTKINIADKIAQYILEYVKK